MIEIKDNKKRYTSLRVLQKRQLKKFNSYLSKKPPIIEFFTENDMPRVFKVISSLDRSILNKFILPFFIIFIEIIILNILNILPTIKSQPSVKINPTNILIQYNTLNSNWPLPNTTGWGPITLVVYRNGLRQAPGIDYYNNDLILIPVGEWNTNDTVLIDFIQNKF